MYDAIVINQIDNKNIKVTYKEFIPFLFICPYDETWIWTNVPIILSLQGIRCLKTLQFRLPMACQLVSTFPAFPQLERSGFNFCPPTPTKKKKKKKKKSTSLGLIMGHQPIYWIGDNCIEKNKKKKKKVYIGHSHEKWGKITSNYKNCLSNKFIKLLFNVPNRMTTYSRLNHGCFISILFPL